MLKKISIVIFWFAFFGFFLYKLIPKYKYLTNGTYKHWSEMLPVFEKELNTFKHKIDSLKKNGSGIKSLVKPFANAAIRTTDNAEASFTIAKGNKAFADTNLVIKSFAKELEGLEAVNLNYKQQLTQGTSISFMCNKPVKILAGYF